MIRIVYGMAAKLSTDIETKPDIQRYLADIYNHHEPTYYHSLRVSTLCVDAAIEIGLPEDDVEMICTAGMIHDVGKVRIPAALLDKNGQLTAEEVDIVKMHVDYGSNILADFQSQEAALIARFFHSFKRSNGYPEIPDDERIAALAKIGACADVYEALMNRKYVQTKQPEELEKILRAELLPDVDVEWAINRLFEGIDYDYEGSVS